MVPPQFALGARCQARSEPLGRITAANRRSFGPSAFFSALRSVVPHLISDRAHSLGAALWTGRQRVLVSLNALDRG